MLHHFGINARRLLLHGAIGSAIGVLTVIAIVAADAFGLGSMIGQAEYSAFHLSAMLFKPSMLFGVGAIGLSVLLQLHGSASRVRGSAVVDQPSYR